MKSIGTSFLLITSMAVIIAGCSQKELPPGPITSGTQFAVTGEPGNMYFDMQGILWNLRQDDRRARPLTGIEDDLRNPRLSPDASWLVFESFTMGAWDIEIMRTDGTERRNLTNSPFDDRQPVWTPDGNNVLFTSDRSGNADIWSIQVNSGEMFHLTKHPAEDYGPEISNEGFLFVSERDGKPALYERRPQEELVRLAEAPAGLMYPPRISPGGAYIAWVQAAERNPFPGIARNELIIYKRETGARTSLSTEGIDIFSVAPAWQDEFTLLLTADGGIQSLNIRNGWMKKIPFNADIALDTNNFEAKLPIAFKQNRQPVLGIVDPVMLPDNSVVFTALGDLWLLSATDELTQLTNDHFVERDVNISPDGTTLTYISDRAGSMQIWLHDLASNDVRRVTKSSAAPRYPTFSPDGTQLAYQQVGPIGTRDFKVRILNIETGASRKLKSSPKLWPGRISWSQDGQHVTVAELAMSSSTASDGRNRLVRIDVNADTTNIENLPDNLTPDSGPVSDAGGLQLALIINGALYRTALNEDGSLAGPPQLILDELVESPAWSRDGKYITALTDKGLETIEIDLADEDGHAGRTTRDINLDWEPDQGGRYIIHAGRIYDGINDGYQNNIDIHVDGARITKIRPHRDHPTNLPIVDASEQTVIPGLIDHHTHFEAHKGEWIGRSLLAFGVTSVVEPGGLPYESRELMESWAAGKRLGPRLTFAGPQLDGTRRIFYFGSHITSEQRLERELERGDRLGYGLLKTYRRLRPDLQARAVELGHDEGLPVTAHAALRNLGFGGDRTEHMRGSGRTDYSPKQSALLKSYGDIEHIYTSTNATLIPTLVNQGAFFDFVANYDGFDEIPQYIALYPANYRGSLTGLTSMVSKHQALVAEGLGNAQATLKQLHDQGVTIVAGTDSPIFPYGLSLVIELNSYVQAGLTPTEALQTATTKAAEVMGAGKHVGRLKKGMLADMVFIEGDPLNNITDLLNVSGVVSNGRYYSQSFLLTPDE